MEGLVNEQFGAADRDSGRLPGGAGLHAGAIGWVLLATEAARSLGPALAWAHQRDVRDLHVVVDDQASADDDGPVVARRAALFAPAPTIWGVHGRTLSPVPPAPVAVSAPAPPEAEEFRPAITEAGAEAVVSHGVLTGEVIGLEVARVILDGDGARLEVGVGRDDREATALLHGPDPDPAVLQGVVATVRRHRAPAAPPHPLNRIGAQRRLRSRILAEPELVGATGLERAAGPLPEIRVSDTVAAIAVGPGRDGRSLVVACSAGIDLDLVPTAADARLMHEPAAGLVLAVPDRDDHPTTRALAAALADPARVIRVPPG